MKKLMYVLTLFAVLGILQTNLFAMESQPAESEQPAAPAEPVEPAMPEQPAEPEAPAEQPASESVAQ